MANDPIEIACPAKLNLALSVGSADATRAQMHPIATWMVALRFADHLSLTRCSVSTYEIFFDGDPVGCQVDWPQEQDLACRAHGVLAEHVGRSLPVKLVLRKRIPPGSGLGGGSSNAAAMLVGLNQLFELGLEDPLLKALGHRIGSDVSFMIGAISGQPSAVVTGFGDRVEPIERQRALHVVLIFPTFGCPTAQIYRVFDDRSGSKRKADEDRVRALSRQSHVAPDEMFNDLAEPACRVRPQLGCILRALEATLSMPVHVSGSGSTLFVLTRSANAAEQLARIVITESGLAAIATSTV